MFLKPHKPEHPSPGRTVCRLLAPQPDQAKTLNPDHLTALAALAPNA